MAQFNCPELGGGGQWMSGGMTMVGDMFNNGLKNTVDNLCCEISNALNVTQIFPVIPQGQPGSSMWWPQDLGQPFSTGGQNNTRYAVFPQRLAVDIDGQVTIYDTLDHQIGGVSQQQGNETTLTFSSQYGTLAVNSLPILSGPGCPTAPQTNFAQPLQEAFEPAPSVAQQPFFHNEANDPSAPFEPVQAQNNPNAVSSSSDEILTLLEKLGQLNQAGILTEQEFQQKKAELLNRL
jgi:hypothetical protein